MSVALRQIDWKEALAFYDLHPQLHDMWARYSLGGFLKHYLRWKVDDHVVRWGQQHGNDEGETNSVLLVIEKSGKSVGFTGYFCDDRTPKDTVRMRWTGIQGLVAKDPTVGSAAVALLCEHLAAKNKDWMYLSESCPWFCRGLRKWFAKNGFKPWDDPDKNGIGIPLIRTVSLRRRIR